MKLAQRIIEKLNSLEENKIIGTEIHRDGYYISLQSSYVGSGNKVYANLYDGKKSSGQSLASAMFDVKSASFSDYSGSSSGQDIMRDMVMSVSSADKKKLAKEWKKFNESMNEVNIDKSDYKTLLRDGDRIFTRDKKTGEKYQTLFVSQTNDGLVIRSGATNGDVLLTLKKPKITVGDLMRELDKKPHNWNTKNMEMSLNESMNESKSKYDDKEFSDWVYDFLKKDHENLMKSMQSRGKDTKDYDPSMVFLGALAYRVEDAFKKDKGMSFSDYKNSEYPKKLKRNLEVAMDKLHGKGTFKKATQNNKRK